MSDNPNALKHMFNQALLNRMATSLKEVYPEFDSRSFKKLMPHLRELEMKPRVLLLRDELKKRLPQNYSQALKVLISSTVGGGVKGFDLWPYTEFIQTYGLDHKEESLEALKALTQLFTSEWAIRPFIKKYPDSTMKFLKDCARDKNVHVRRWASEGTRPRLPWGERLHDFVKDPGPTLKILEYLKFDSELYVRKSVSNHLNDIAKDHPDLVVKVLKKWQKTAGKQHKTKIDWIIRRSLRTLIKQGHSGALALMGVDPKAKYKMGKVSLKSKKIKLGEKIEFSFELKSLAKSPQTLVVDYIIHFVKSNNKTAPKVFKLKTLQMPGASTVKLEKSHTVKKITTREYYSGLHVLEIQINGRSTGRQEWRLEV